MWDKKKTQKKYPEPLLSRPQPPVPFFFFSHPLLNINPRFPSFSRIRALESRTNACDSNSYARLRVRLLSVLVCVCAYVRSRVLPNHSALCLRHTCSSDTHLSVLFYPSASHCSETATPRMQHNGHSLSSRSPPAANIKSVQHNRSQSHDQNQSHSQDQDSDDGNQLQSGDENDLDQDDQDVTRLGKRKRPISVSYVVPRPSSPDLTSPHPMLCHSPSLNPIAPHSSQLISNPAAWVPCSLYPLSHPPLYLPFALFLVFNCPPWALPPCPPNHRRLNPCLPSRTLKLTIQLQDASYASRERLHEVPFLFPPLSLLFSLHLSFPNRPINVSCAARS